MSKLALLGGTPVRSHPFSPRVSMGREEKAAASRVLDSDVLSGFVGAKGKYFNGGVEVTSFEHLWCKQYGFENAISTNSWTTGLQTIIGAIGIEPGDEVICPPYTMSATSTAVLFYGGIPVFADIDPSRLTICPTSIESKITNKTKAIMVVHLFGCPADMDPILEIAHKYKLIVIEDAAQSPGVTYKDNFVGCLGDIGGFSFNYHKHVQCGEGGLIVTNHDKLAHNCRLIRNHGENYYDNSVDCEVKIIGSNYRLTEIQAAIASEQTKKLPSFLEHRQKLAVTLNKRLSGLTGIDIQQIESNSTHAYYMYPIRFNDELVPISRGLFLKAVNAELPKATSWETTPLTEGYVKPLYLNPIYQNLDTLSFRGFPFNSDSYSRYDYNQGLCPVAESMYNSTLLLSPFIREGLDKNDINDFADAIEKVITNIDGLSKITHSASYVYDAVKAIDDI